MQQSQDLLHHQQSQQHQQQQYQQQQFSNNDINNSNSQQQHQQQHHLLQHNGASPTSGQQSATTTATHSAANTAPQSPVSTGTTVGRTQISGGRFDFEDGGTYCGGWEEGKAHGQGVCTGPKHQGAYSGAWNYGFEVSGVYIWPSGSSFEGQWQNGRRHGLGVETRGRWLYRGEWTSGSKGRYGVRQSVTSTAKYEGTWAGGLQDGYGSETYADGGSYQGQWQEGKRHGYGVRTSAPFGLASHYRPKNIQASMTSLRSNEPGNADPAEKRNHRMDEGRGGFVLKASSDVPLRRNSLVEKTKKGLLSGLKLKKQRSTGDLEKRGTAASGSIRSTVSTTSWLSGASSQSAISNKSQHTDSNASFTVDEEHLDPSITETYMGEWKRDKRDGYGISERSDGLKYEGEWHNNKKHGYGVTTLRDGTKEEGKYKYNVLITSQKKKHLFLIRSAKFRERIEAAVSSAQRASKYALQKADIAISRTATARGKAEMADNVADQAKLDSEIAVATAREFAPDFKPSVLERFERIRLRERYRSPTDINIGFKPTVINPLMNTPSHHQPPLPTQSHPQLENRTSNPLLSSSSSATTTPQHYSTGGPSINQTPNKQQSFSQSNPQQPHHETQTTTTSTTTIRRQSMLQKQSSIDYPISVANSNLNNINNINNHNINNNLYSQQSQSQSQPQQQQLQSNSTSSYNYNNSTQQQQPTFNYSTKSTNIQQNSNQMYQQQNSQNQSNTFNNSSIGNSQQSNYSNLQQQPAQTQSSTTQQQSNSPYYGFSFLQDQQQQQQQQQSPTMPQPTILPSNQMYPPINTDIGNQFLQDQHQQSPQHHHQQQQMYNYDNNTMQYNDNQQQQQQGMNLRRNSRPVHEGGRPPMLGSYNQSSIDHFDHYKRPPSRDSSVDRYARATSRLSGTIGTVAGSSNTNNNNINNNNSSNNNNNNNINNNSTMTGTTTGGNPIGNINSGISNSRQPSIDRTIQQQQQQHNTPDRNIRAGSAFRGTPTTPTTPSSGSGGGGVSPSIATGNGAVMTGRGISSSSRAGTPAFHHQHNSNTSSGHTGVSSNLQATYSNPNQPFEDVLLRQRTLGQDIIPSPRQPNRTESLYVPPKPVLPMGGGGGGQSGGGGKSKLKSVPIVLPLSRKKSLPDVQELPRATDPMSREEVSALGSARREEVRRQIENSERLKANPLLYLVSPQVKDWFSRQQLVMLVLVVNIALAIMFFKMLT